MGEVARSARKYGLKFGVYLSPWDRHDPRYTNPEAYEKYYFPRARQNSSTRLRYRARSLGSVESNYFAELRNSTLS